jgi:hypothetical protein
MIDELERMWKSSRGLIWVGLLPHHSPGWTEENHSKTLSGELVTLSRFESVVPEYKSEMLLLQPICLEASHGLEIFYALIRFCLVLIFEYIKIYWTEIRTSLRLWCSFDLDIHSEVSFPKFFKRHYVAPKAMVDVNDRQWWLHIFRSRNRKQ